MSATWSEENIDARLQLLGDGSGNADPVRPSEVRRALHSPEVKKLVTALKTNPEATETLE